MQLWIHPLLRKLVLVSSLKLIHWSYWFSSLSLAVLGHCGIPESPLDFPPFSCPETAFPVCTGLLPSLCSAHSQISVSSRGSWWRDTECLDWLSSLDWFIRLKTRFYILLSDSLQRFWLLRITLTCRSSKIIMYQHAHTRCLGTLAMRHTCG